ncbi:MAG: hypothetical protein PHE59_01705 [Patescibacteria group bacterium]|nr:hypothetical protein [Patescibacteria group bacterium]MDD5164902.1 hypothetical protein [Patescibacteria group bacterium]MDD5534707.1 hypothetical protein [Patescibacteria group bacterium]
MSHFFAGLGIIAVGVILTLNSEWLLRTIGPVEWAEQKLGGDGGSRLFYKLLGLAVVVLGLFVISGIWEDILNGIAKLFGLAGNNE